MQKLRKVLAWIGIIVLLGLYVITFILGLTGSPATKNLLMASIACTVIVPVLLYAMMLLAKTMSWHLPSDDGADTGNGAGKKDTPQRNAAGDAAPQKAPVGDVNPKKTAENDGSADETGREC